MWSCELDIYGKVRTLAGSKTFIPFRYQGQYEDEETGLYYNRFRYYSPDSGTYISQDPIGLEGEMPNMYSYVHDLNAFVDPFGLISTNPGVYDIFHESFLPKNMFRMTDYKHFQEANRQLYNSMKNNPALKNALESKYPGIFNYVSPTPTGRHAGRAFKGTTWHHHPTIGGLLQLVDRADHKIRFPDYHPNGKGGRNNWGGGSRCR